MAFLKLLSARQRLRHSSSGRRALVAIAERQARLVVQTARVTLRASSAMR